MKLKHIALVMVIPCLVLSAIAALAADVNGLWTKTISPDPDNVAIFYQEKNVFQAMGYSRLQGKNVVWYGAGQIDGNDIHCSYHHSLETLPAGWGQSGVMRLTVSEDGNQITGTAESISGKWKGKMVFRRLP
jgi:hypothetical protein